MASYDKAGNLLVAQADAVNLSGFDGTVWTPLKTRSASGDGVGILAVARLASARYTPLNALAIRDTVQHYGTIDALDGFRDAWVYVINSLDQAVSLWLGLGPYGAIFGSVTVAASGGGWLVPAGAVEGAVIGVKPVLAGPVPSVSMGPFQVGCQCAVAPTTGSLSVTVIGGY